MMARAIGALGLVAATLPMVALAQSNTVAPQTIPGLDGFNLPARPKPTPSPTLSGPLVAPLNQPTATPTAAPTPSVTPPPVVATTPRPSASTTPSPTAARPTATPTPSATPTSVAPTPSASASPEPTASATAEPVPAPVPIDQPTESGSTGSWLAAGVGALAIAGVLLFLFGRRRRRGDAESEVQADEPQILDRPIAVPPPPVPAPAPPPPPPAPSGLLTVPSPRARRVVEGDEPRIEIVLIPRRAGTNLTSAAVDYRVLLRNAGAVDARDIRFGIYMLSASARQAADLQQIFAAEIAQPAVAPFALAAGQEIELSGMALLPRDNINVMTIDGKPWFVPVLALKASYRWGENVGAPGVATAAHMIGIDRGEGAKMAPFRLDSGPMMHSEVAERRVA